MRDRRRRGEAGFTLVELMVVVILIAILAMLAGPALRRSRDDRLAFDYARQYSQIIHRARTRAMARGSAHLVAINTAGTRGTIRLFEAVDATPPAQNGPKPVSSCKGATQWAGVPTFAVGASPPLSPVVEGVDLNQPGANVDMNLQTEADISGVTRGAVVLCYTPSGNVYAAGDADLSSAIQSMLLAQPFTGVIEIRVMRRDAANTPIGLTRRVLVGAAGAPRIQSR